MYMLHHMAISLWECYFLYTITKLSGLPEIPEKEMLVRIEDGSNDTT